MITIKHAWVGFVVLLIVVLLVVAATLYWQHVTGVNALHLLADEVTHGC